MRHQHCSSACTPRCRGALVLALRTALGRGQGWAASWHRGAGAIGPSWHGKEMRRTPRVHCSSWCPCWIQPARVGARPAFSTAAVAALEGSWARGGAGQLLPLCWQLWSSVVALGPALPGVQDERDRGQCGQKAPVSCQGAAWPQFPLVCRICVWLGAASAARQSQPCLPSSSVRFLLWSVRCALPAAAARRCLPLLGSVCVPGPALLEPLCARPCSAGLCPTGPLCSQEAG